MIITSQLVGIKGVSRPIFNFFQGILIIFNFVLKREREEQKERKREREREREKERKREREKKRRKRFSIPQHNFMFYV